MIFFSCDLLSPFFYFTLISRENDINDTRCMWDIMRSKGVKIDDDEIAALFLR
jgi:hypothetical protein